MTVESITIGKTQVKPCRIFCIGKNYSDHTRELNDPDVGSQSRTADHPVIFMKPATSIVPPGEPIHVPVHGRTLHHEVEVVVLLNGGGKNILADDSFQYIAGITLGLDITLRDVQDGAKKKGHPWELSKSFDHSSPLGQMHSYDGSFDLFNISFACFVNGEKRQEGNTKDMIFSIPKIISFLSTVWELLPGDLIYTGTPSGVGAINKGDKIILEGPIFGRFKWHVF